MPTYSLYLADAVAICILVFALFMPRHRRPELIVAYLTVNVGVLAVAAALANSTIGAGLGLGLFGILSIIRLRSEELAQHEVAYYFAALALGLLGGLDTGAEWMDIALMVAVLAAIAVGDHPRIASLPQTQQLLVDSAITDPGLLVDELERVLAADVISARPIRTDVVNDTTLVDVRYRHPRSGRRSTAAREREVVR